MLAIHKITMVLMISTGCFLGGSCPRAAQDLVHRVFEWEIVLWSTVPVSLRWRKVTQLLSSCHGNIFSMIGQGGCSQACEHLVHLKILDPAAPPWRPECLSTARDWGLLTGPSSSKGGRGFHVVLMRNLKPPKPPFASTA